MDYFDQDLDYIYEQEVEDFINDMTNEPELKNVTLNGKTLFFDNVTGDFIDH